MLKSLQNRPLKKPTLGPPGVYHQTPNQKEDELTSSVLKRGYPNDPVCEEHGSARKEASLGLTEGQLIAYVNGIMNKKTEYNTINDTGKKKPPASRDHFFVVTPAAKHQELVEKWMSSLANPSKSLNHLGKKKVPILPKKEDILVCFYKYSVPPSRATWHLKMTAAHSTAQAETRKASKRQGLDFFSEWMKSITTHMQDLLTKMVEYYNGSGVSSAPGGFLTSGAIPVDIESTTKQWSYMDKLTGFMYQEGLLDRQEFLSWTIQMLEKTKARDENITRILLSMVFQYTREIVKQYLLSRRLAEYCATKLGQMAASSGYVSPRSTSPHFDMSTPQRISPTAQASLVEIWSDYLQCPQHRNILFMLSALIHAVVLACPSALVWLNLGEGKSLFIHSGSPLDLLPCHPCLLPMPEEEESIAIRKHLRDCEIDIARRSTAAELSWSSDKVQQSMTGFVTGKLLRILDTLDKYDFGKSETSPAISNLYSRVMETWNEKSSNEPYTSMEPLVFILCEWAITTKRQGAHRAAIVARFLDLYQTELWNSPDNDHNMDTSDPNKDGTTEDSIFYEILLNFLDKKAPVLDDVSSNEQNQSFSNLVALYGELIRLDLFSHDSYMCTLISRGELDPSSATSKPEPSASTSAAASNVGKSLLQEILETDENQSPTEGTSSSFAQSHEHAFKPQNRHAQYVTHFPIPQEDQFTHEVNQRSVALYGFGKGRDIVKNQAKKVGRELTKLFHKRACIDVSATDPFKVKPKSDAELEQLLWKFKSLPYYEQYCMASTVIENIIESYKSFIGEESACSHIPHVEHIQFFLDLIENSLNIDALIYISEKLLELMTPMETKIRAIEYDLVQLILTGKYTQHITVYIVGQLNCNLPSLLLNPQACIPIFAALVDFVHDVRDPKQCSSAQRCIFLMISSVLYQSSFDIKEDRKWSQVAGATQQIQQTLCEPVHPAVANGIWDRTFGVTESLNFNIYKFRFSVSFNRSMNDNKTSFVTNTLIGLCDMDKFDRVNEVAFMCCEYTSYCHVLSSEWLGALKALCCNSESNGYTDLLSNINVARMSPHQLECIATFTAILIARHCFSLTDFIAVAITSIVGDVSVGAVLTLHILLRVFTTSTSLKDGLLKRSHYIRSSCDLHLLVAANRSIDSAALLAVLRAMLILAYRTLVKDEMDNIVVMKASQVLKEICAEGWLCERLLQHPERLLAKDMLLDELKPLESWMLVQLICRGRPIHKTCKDDINNFGKQEAVITRILRSLDQWSLRVAYLELQLMYELQNPNHEDGVLSLLLDNIARSTIDVFHSYTETTSQSDDISAKRDTNNQREGVWLVAPLIAKLSTLVQGRVLSSAALVLENSNKLWQSSKSSAGDQESSMSLLNHQPFLSLVLTCLKGHDEQREVILTSLSTQLEKFITCAQEDKLPSNPQQLQQMYEALQLRLSLIGGMFDTIQRTHAMTNEWSQLLNKLIYYNIVDIHSNSELFLTVLDMLSALIHSMLVSDTADNVENNKKPYSSLIKKLKKDIGDRRSDSANLVRQLFTLPRRYIDVIACETHGSLLDTKGNKIQGFESVTKKSGLQVSSKHTVSPWDMLEGIKPSPVLSLTWFNAVKLEKKMLPLIDQARLMQTHDHTVPNTDNFMTPPPLPKEDEVDLTVPTELEIVKQEPEERASALAAKLPNPKAVTKTKTKRQSSRTTTTPKPTFGATAGRYEPRTQYTPPAAMGQPGQWAGPRPVQPGYPAYYSQHSIPRMAGMVGPRSDTKKELQGHLLRNKKVGEMIIPGGPGGMSYGAQGGGMPTGMDPGSISGSTQPNEALRNHVLRRQKLPNAPEYDQQPPPQYPSGSGQYPRPMGSYSSQPPGYMSQPNQGMVMSGGQGHPGQMISYGGNVPSQPGLPSYQQAGQQQGYSQQYGTQYQDNRSMMPGSHSQYMTRPTLHSNPNQPPQGQYSSNIQPYYPP